jgi:hypothetical protein
MVKKTDKTPPEMAAAAEKAKASKPAKPKPAPEGREIKLSKRQVKMTNLNFSPEKAGTELVERVDLSLQMILTTADLDLFLESRTDLPSKLLFDDEGNPAIPAATAFPLELQAAGACTFGPTGAKTANAFKSAVLKRCHLELMFGHQATLSCQIRVSPGGHLDELGKLVIEKQALFSFNGSAELDDDADEQEELAL